MHMKAIGGEQTSPPPRNCSAAMAPSSASGSDAPSITKKGALPPSSIGAGEHLVGRKLQQASAYLG